MKKLLSIALTLTLLLSLATAPVFAIAVKSPTQGGEPDIQLLSDDFTDENGNPVGDDDCRVKLEITPYQEKDNADDMVIKQSLERAYDSYKNDFTADARAMLSAADPQGGWKTKYPGWNLQVVNIFDITLLCEKDIHHYDNYEGLLKYHGEHYVSMELSDADASNFVALMHYYDADHVYETKGDAYWELVPTIQKGNEISFSVKCSNLSPFAIIVKSRPGEEGSQDHPSPQTGEADFLPYCAVAAAILALAGFTAFRRKKEEENAR